MINSKHSLRHQLHNTSVLSLPAMRDKKNIKIQKENNAYYTQMKLLALTLETYMQRFAAKVSWHLMK